MEYKDKTNAGENDVKGSDSFAGIGERYGQCEKDPSDNIVTNACRKGGQSDRVLKELELGQDSC